MKGDSTGTILLHPAQRLLLPQFHHDGNTEQSLFRLRLHSQKDQVVVDLALEESVAQVEPSAAKCKLKKCALFQLLFCCCDKKQLGR